MTTIVIKSETAAYYYDGTNIVQITDLDYPSPVAIAVTSITRTGTTATVTTTAATALATGDSVVISGATPTEYNGTKTITVTDSTHFTFTCAGTETTPATGTIVATANATKSTVPGVVYLDDYYFVMDANGQIWGSASGNPSSWSALNYISAEMEPDAGVGIAKWQNYVVAFGEWTTELFYDAGNPAPGSPLSRVSNSVQQIGCAHGKSVCDCDGALVWIGVSRSKGRSVYMVGDAFSPTKISTDDIDRILDRDSMSTIYSWAAKIDGHRIYVLTLVASGLTLVCDIDTGLWYRWTSMTAQATKSCTITQASGIATVTCTAHGYADGDPVVITGATPTAYNGTKNISYVDANTFTFEVDAATATPATGTITVYGYTESHFSGTFYSAAGGRNLVMSSLDGKIYELNSTMFSDDGLPINFKVRTGKFDADNDQRKTMSRLELIGDKVAANAFVRWSDDDYTTNTAYRKVDLSAERSILRRCGDFRRRSLEIRHTDNTAARLSSVEIDIEQGVS